MPGNYFESLREDKMNCEQNLERRKLQREAAISDEKSPTRGEASHPIMAPTSNNGATTGGESAKTMPRCSRICLIVGLIVLFLFVAANALAGYAMYKVQK